jgi:TonB family protein
MLQMGVMLLGIACSCFGAASDPKHKVPYGGSVTSFEDLVYPASAREANVQGAVVIRATLDDGGNVVDVFALSGSRALIPDCLVNAKKWKFQPNPEKIVIIVYDFRIEEGGMP